MIDPSRELKAKLTEIETSIKRLNQEREDLIDEIADTYSALQELGDYRYALPN